jgi:hypothetical protein
LDGGKKFETFAAPCGYWGVEFKTPDRTVVRRRKLVIETVKRIFNQLGGTGTSLNPGSTKEFP